MGVTIKYQTFLRKKLRKKSDCVFLPDRTTLIDLISKYVCSQNSEVRNYLMRDDKQRLGQHITIFVNGKKCIDSNSVISNDDVVNIVSPISGG
jgi:molybdopterin converting factor small subunit